MNDLTDSSAVFNRVQTLVKNKCCIRLSVSGACYIVVAFVLYLFSVNYSSNLLLTLVFFLVGILMTCFWLSISNIRSIEVLSVNVDPVYQGQTLQYQLTALNKRKRNNVNLWANGHLVDDIENGVEQRWLMNESANQRGMYPVQPLCVSSRWPLGLFKLSTEVIGLPSVVIYPKAAEALHSKQRIEDDRAHYYNDADSLVGLRDYQPGDNARRIDWRAMARRDQLQVKLFDGGSGDASVWLDWDDTEGMPYENRISALCRWILDYQKLGVEFGLRLPGFGLAPANTIAHTHQCLTQLALLPSQFSNSEIKTGADE